MVTESECEEIATAMLKDYFTRCGVATQTDYINVSMKAMTVLVVILAAMSGKEGTKELLDAAKTFVDGREFEITMHPKQ